MTHQLEQKVDALSASVDQRFDAIDAAIMEQREYTEFAYSRLDAKMDARFGTMDARFDTMDARFDTMDARFDTMDARFARLERKLDQFIGLHLPPRSSDKSD